MNVTTATPVEIDTRLAELYRQAGQAEAKVLAAAVNIHYALGEKPHYVTRTRKTWPTTDAEAVEAARARGDERIPRSGGGYTYADMVAKYDDAAAAVAAIEAEAAPLNAEYVRRGRWSRFFTVQQHNGHIHSDMSCSTCNRGQYLTQFGWNPELSGLTEAEAVAKLGPSLCTVCFPSAPVEWTVGADKKADQCDGSRKAPIEGSTKRTGMRRYGDCTKCTDRPLINGDGTVRAHKPKAPREQAPAAPEAPAPAAPVVDEPAAPVVEQDQADDQAPPATVVIERYRLTPTHGRGMADWTFGYSYRVNGGPVAQYGNGLKSLRSMLAKRFPGARIVESWKAPAAPAPAAEAAPVVEQDQAAAPAAPAEAPTPRRIPGGRPTTAQARFLAALPVDGSASRDAMQAVSTPDPIRTALARGWATQEPWGDGTGRVQHRVTPDGLWAIGREQEAAALRSVELAAAADRARTGDRFADGTAAAREALAIAGEQDQADEQPAGDEPAAGAAFPECSLDDGHAGLCAVPPAPAAARPRNIRDLALRLVDAVRAGDTAAAQRIDDELTGRLVAIEAAALTVARMAQHLPIQQQGDEQPALAILTAVHGEPQACRCPAGTHLTTCYWGTWEAQQASARSWADAEDELA